MDSIIEQLSDISNTNEEIEDVRNELIEFKENLIDSLEALDPLNGIDDVMEDIDLLIQKINGHIDW
ncbi:hypothetical protein IO99_17945 [Clostridium sulfidigenes]|uniref:Uncharacterized protein n=1 Tax=Clostridium sulfidigenes TaxID=318464 RepID=A0A084J7F1_9CLOT|nr:hypothetical protein [Clostridium sulfidigenes]KEZ84885.1 hypothetical protein IO99_17945 [Clostridium sulfidigenes]